MHWAAMPSCPSSSRNSGCSNEGMLAYTAHELLQLRNNYVPPSRQSGKLFIATVCGHLVLNKRVFPWSRRLRKMQTNITTTHRTIKHSAAVDRKQPVAPWSGQLIMYVPSLYVFNAAGLAKPHAVEQLAAELSSHGADVALITETHFKVWHTDSVIDIPDYCTIRFSWWANVLGMNNVVCSTACPWLVH